MVSHGHADHWGLAPYAAPGLRIVTGAATRRIMGAAAAFVPRAVAFAEGDEGRMDLIDRQTIQVGPFAITPYLVDHSAYDAYAMLIEAGGRRLFYSADIRGHGRKAALFERLLAHPPLPVHAMLMEGSSLGRLRPDQGFPSEQDIEARLVDAFSAPGFCRGLRVGAEHRPDGKHLPRLQTEPAARWFWTCTRPRCWRRQATRTSRKPGGPTLPSTYPSISGGMSSGPSAST